MARPRKVKFPVGLDELLRLALRRKRPEDRFKYYRMELRDSLMWHLGRQPTKDEIDQEVAKARALKYDANDAARFSFAMSEHLPIFEREIRQNRAKAMAAGRWSKENREKHKKAS